MRKNSFHVNPIKIAELHLQNTVNNRLNSREPTISIENHSSNKTSKSHKSFFSHEQDPIEIQHKNSIKPNQVVSSIGFGSGHSLNPLPKTNSLNPFKKSKRSSKNSKTIVLPRIDVFEPSIELIKRSNSDEMSKHENDAKDVDDNKNYIDSFKDDNSKIIDIDDVNNDNNNENDNNLSKFNNNPNSDQRSLIDNFKSYDIDIKPNDIDNEKICEELPDKSDKAKQFNKIPSLNEIKEETPARLSDSVIIKSTKLYYFSRVIKKLNKKLMDFLKNLFLLNLNRFAATSYSTFYLPLYLSFEDLHFNGVLLFFEIYCILIYIWSFFYEFRKVYLLLTSSKVHNHVKYSQVIMTMLYHFIMIIPFCYIFEVNDVEDRRTNLFFLILELIRISNFKHILWILTALKRKIPAFGKFLEIIVIYMDISHIFACLFIVFGKLERNFNYMWMVKVPAPQINYPNNNRDYLNISDESLYLHALYWGYVTSSHIGMGDVCPITWQEKLYGTIVMIITTFTYIYFFGNMAALFQDLVFYNIFFFFNYFFFKFFFKFFFLIWFKAFQCFFF